LPAVRSERGADISFSTQPGPKAAVQECLLWRRCWELSGRSGPQGENPAASRRPGPHYPVGWIAPTD